MLIDDHAVVRAGYRRFLEQEPGYQVIAVKTVANYHSQLRHKLGVSTDIELFQLACDCGVIDTSARPTSES